MTVIIEKPAINLREELADLRNQGGYQEQQFWFENAVTNGTFDTGTSGWTASASSIASVSGQLQVTNTSASFNAIAYQSFATEAGKTYTLSVDNVGGSDNGRLNVGNSILGIEYGGNIYVPSGSGTSSVTFIATTTTVFVKLKNNSNTLNGTTLWDNVSVFETDGTDVVHRMPKGWVPKDVFEDGLLQREGAANDYTVVYDGFDYYVKPAVAPSATTQTCVIGVRK